MAVVRGVKLASSDSVLERYPGKVNENVLESLLQEASEGGVAKNIKVLVTKEVEVKHHSRKGNYYTYTPQVQAVQLLELYAMYEQINGSQFNSGRTEDIMPDLDEDERIRQERASMNLTKYEK